MQAKVAAAITMMDQHDRVGLSRGALQRYLAEAVWFPTALLPREGLKWTAVDDSTALATLTDSGITVSLRPTGLERSTAHTRRHLGQAGFATTRCGTACGFRSRARSSGSCPPAPCRTGGGGWSRSSTICSVDRLRCLSR